MTEKIIGYILLIVGLMIIVFSIFAAYQVFTKQAAPVELFRFPGISMDITKMLSQNLPKEIAQSLPLQQQEIIPADMINQPMNYFTYLVFMGFIASGGVKIAGLGVQLLRPVTIKMPDKPTIQTKSN